MNPDACPGQYRRAVIMLSIGQVVCWAALYFAFSSFVLPMQQSLGWSKSTLMGAFTLGLTVWGLSAFPVGAAIDRGHGRVVLAGGALLGGIGILLWSQVTEPWMFYAVCCVLGIAMAMTLYEPAFAVLTRRYPTHYRDGITTLTLVGGFATTLSFPASVWLIQGLGWRDALIVIGLVLAVAIAPMHALALRGPADAQPGTASRGPHEDGLTADATMEEALRTQAFWLLALTFAGYAFAAAALWAHVVPALLAKGLSESGALAVLIWVGPAQVASRLLFRLLGTRLTPRMLGFCVYAGQVVAFLIFAGASGEAGLVVFAILFGVVSGLAAIVRGNLVPAYFGRANIGRIGGSLSSFSLYARAAAPVGAAVLLAWPMGYDALMMVLAGVSALTLVAYGFARKPA
jgi:hypothetical protein